MYKTYGMKLREWLKACFDDGNCPRYGTLVKDNDCGIRCSWGDCPSKLHINEVE